MVTTINGVGLDWKAQEVLEAIVENGGEANTSEVKQYTGLERNEVVKYRFAKLSEARLVETRQPSTENGRPSAKVASLTGEGRAILDGDDLDFEVAAGDDSLTLDERVERLEKQVGRMRETYGEVKQRLVELEAELDQHDSDLDEQSAKIRRIVNRLEDSRTSAGDGRE